MAAKKKPATTAAATTQNKAPEKAAKAIMDLADNLPELESEPEKEAPVSGEQNDQEKQELKEQESITSDTPCPFEAIVSVALAVLRKTTELGTSEMLKPVSTLKQGTKVTVVAVRGGGCLLRNGLWIATEYLTK